MYLGKESKCNIQIKPLCCQVADAHDAKMDDKFQL